MSGVWQRLRRSLRAAGAPLRSKPSSESEASGPRSVGDAVHLRRYPYPFRCALAIANDVDGMTREAFEDWHRFVSGRGPTPYGEGLGLEVGDSLWLWSRSGCISLFQGAPNESLALSPAAARLAELGRLGWIDTLHGFGEWDAGAAPTRRALEAALVAARELGLRWPVFTNHGGVEMTTNLGGPWAYYQRGDSPGAAEYCADLLRSTGVRYVWTDPFFELEKFGEELTFTDQAELDRASSAHELSRFFVVPTAAGASITRPVFADLSADEQLAWRRRLFNRALIEVPLADGAPAFFFKRFRGPLAPTSGNFACQVEARRLDELEQRQGAVIIYQHFGYWRAAGFDRGHASQRRSTVPVLDEHARWAFRELAERQNDGRLFVTTTARLLDYLWIRDRLRLTVEPRPDGYVVTIGDLHCPVRGDLVPGEGDLQGVSIEVPRGWTNVRLHSSAGPISTQRHPGEPGTGRDVLVVPWRRMEYPVVAGGE